MATPIGCGTIYALSRDHVPGLKIKSNQVDRADRLVSEGLGVATMKRGLAILLSAIVVIAVLGALIAAGAKTMEQPLVRIAELEIDAGQVEAYTNALREEIETSVRVEPGVLALYAVSVKGQPNQIRIFETYKDAAAYANRIYKRHTSRSTKLRLKVW